LKKEIENQNKFIVIVKGFFSSNSEFIKLYHQKPEGYHQKMKSSLDNHEKKILKFLDLAKNVI
jgi:hypothetical protein